MEITVKFAGGPLDGQTAATDGLDQAKIFFDEKDRKVFLYVRVDELVYAFSHEQSVALTKIYDQTRKHFDARQASSIRFTGESENDHETD